MKDKEITRLQAKLDKIEKEATKLREVSKLDKIAAKKPVVKKISVKKPTVKKVVSKITEEAKDSIDDKK